VEGEILMIDQYGCDENDFICKINAKQALANQVAPTTPQSQGSSDYNPQPYTPQTQDQRDFNLADTVAQNQQARNSWNGQSTNETIGNIMGIPMSMANVMAGGGFIPIGTMAAGVGNLSQGINPYDTTDTYDWYKGDTNSQGNPTGPAGSFERGLQGTYGNQYEKDIASMFGDGSPEHFAAISEQMGNTPTVQAQDGWFDGLLNSIGIGTSSAMPNFDNIVTGDGDNSGGNSGFHDSSHNWN
jgi:hypothetical protein